MKTVIFGDIHGRTIWKNILEKEQPDRVIFLGDYLSTHEYIPEESQIANLKDILDYKESHDNVIMLLGNHDLEALGYKWAECYPEFGLKSALREIRARFLANTQFVFVEDKIIYSHAGVSSMWFDKLKAKYDIKDVADINKLELNESFGFTAGPDNPFDSYGYSRYQPCTWIRPVTLAKCAVPGTHIVGHTTVKEVTHIFPNAEELETDEVADMDLWLCDALGSKSYLVQENNGEFVSKKYETN